MVGLDETMFAIGMVPLILLLVIISPLQCDLPVLDAQNTRETLPKI